MALIVRPWEVCGYKYKTQQQLNADAEDMGAITVWLPKSLGAVVEKAAGKDASTHVLHDFEICLSPCFRKMRRKMSGRVTAMQIARPKERRRGHMGAVVARLPGGRG